MMLFTHLSTGNINNSEPTTWVYSYIYPMLECDSRFWLANNREV